MTPTIGLSDASALAWNLATLEAQSATDDEIRPDHFFLAICKIVDVPVGGLREDSPEMPLETVNAMEKEVQYISRILEQAGISARALRLHLREKIGEAGRSPSDRIWHRDAQAREMIQRAMQVAMERRADAITLMDILLALIHRPQGLWIQAMDEKGYALGGLWNAIVAD
jgi:ATP-dependent Clp protease ATP-binding subunit ClpC